MIQQTYLRLTLIMIVFLVAFGQATGAKACGELPDIEPFELSVEAI